jgi:leucyl/phenylalanyl-tRNA---protein transferase
VPVFRIPEDKIIFPHPSQATRQGLLGIGGNLSIERILLAYQNGIFPWNNEGEEVLWWCLTPRLILYPPKLKLSKSMKSWMKNYDYQFSFDQSFEEVIESCSQIKRNKQEGTWIHSKLKEIFIELNNLGIAHSVEIKKNNQLVGGLYGIGIGKMFCGESMFAKESNTSKLALYHLCKKLTELDYQFIDCQQDTAHLKSLGAELISKNKFFAMLEENKVQTVENQKW